MAAAWGNSKCSIGYTAHHEAAAAKGRGYMTYATAMSRLKHVMSPYLAGQGVNRASIAAMSFDGAVIACPVPRARTSA